MPPHRPMRNATKRHTSGFVHSLYNNFLVQRVCASSTRMLRCHEAVTFPATRQPTGVLSSPVYIRSPCSARSASEWHLPECRREAAAARLAHTSASHCNGRKLREPTDRNHELGERPCARSLFSILFRHGERNKNKCLAPSSRWHKLRGRILYPKDNAKHNTCGLLALPIRSTCSMSATTRERAHHAIAARGRNGS